MRKVKLWHVAMGIAILFGFLVMLFVVIMNVNILTIKSPYAGYELGYEPTILRSEKFCSTQMKNTDNVDLSGEFYNKAIYNLDNEKKVTTIESKKNILKLGKYNLKVSLGPQAETVLISVFDTIKPYFLYTYDNLNVTEITQNTLAKYIAVEDFSEKIELTYYEDTDSELLYIMATDESHNFAEMKIKYKLVKKETESTRVPEGMENTATYIFKKAKTIEDYYNIRQTHKKEHEFIVEKEDDLRNKLLTKEEYNKVKEEIEKKHEEIETENEKNSEKIPSDMKPTPKPEKEDKEDKDNDKEDKEEEDKPQACTDKAPRNYFVNESTARGSTPNGWVFKGWTGSTVEVCGRVYREAKYEPKPKPKCEPKLKQGQYATEDEARQHAKYPETAEIGTATGNCGQTVYVITHQGYRTWMTEEEKAKWESAEVEKSGKYIKYKVRVGKEYSETDIKMENSKYVDNLVQFLNAKNSSLKFVRFFPINIELQATYTKL